MNEKDLYSFVGSAGLLAAESAFSFFPGGIIFPLALTALSGGMIINDFKANKWESIFKNVGLVNSDKKSPTLIKTEENELGARYIFNLPYGFCFNDFEKRQSELETALCEPIKLDLTNNFKVVIQIFNAKYKDVYKLDNTLLKNDVLTYPVGITLTSEGPKNVNIEFNRSNSHMLVCGMTGKGKTVFMQNLIAQTMLKNNTEVYICDLKATGSYNVFKDCKNLITLVKTVNDTIKTLNKVKEIMIERYKILDEKNLNDQQEYNRKYKNKKMKNIILEIEEFVILSKNTEVIDLLYLLLSQASGAGIYIWLTVQRPDAKTLDTRLKALLSYTVAFKAKNSSNSEVYLDKGDFRAAKELKGKGEAILVTDDEDFFFKAFYLENDEIKEMVKSTYIEKVVKMEEVKPVKLKQIIREEVKKVVDLLD